MIVTDKEQIKKRQQIFNLKTLLFTENTTSKKLKSKITELKSIFKLIKKIIKENINQIELNKNDRAQNEFKKQVCNEINKMIIIYNDKNNILISNKNKERKIIREKINQMKLSLKEMKYYELKDIKDLIVQIIQEKKDSYAQILSHLKDQKDIFFLFQQKYFYHYNNLYDFKMISFEGDKKLEEKISKLKTKFNHNKKFLKKEGEKVLIKLEDELENEKLIFNKYIEDKGFHFKFNNNHYKEQYDIEIETINKTNYSSDSSSSSDNSENDNSILIDDFLFMNNNNNSKKNSLEKNNSKDKKIKIENKRNKKHSYPSNDGKYSLFNEKSRKSRNITLTDDEENKNAKVNLINKLVEIKEKYNKLINEKYELEYRVKKMEKKIKNIKEKISPIIIIGIFKYLLFPRLIILAKL